MRTMILAGCVVALLFSASAAQEEEDIKKVNPKVAGTIMKIKLASVFVDDQGKAEEFYTGVLGFVKKNDIPLGEFRWLTVVSSDDPDGAELLLEPNSNPAAKTFQKAIYDQGIPATSLFVEDVQETFERLKTLGVKFTMEPTDVGTTIIAVFDDTCGNLIQIAQE